MEGDQLFNQDPRREAQRNNILPPELLSTDGTNLSVWVGGLGWGG